MTHKALAQSFENLGKLPVIVDDVLQWIRQNTDFKNITLHAVERQHRGFRGAFRKRGVPKGPLYSADYDIFVDILYGEDLSDDWKRLVIVKEALHVFDGASECVDAPEKLQSLIPSIIDPVLKEALQKPALNDHWGQFRAMAVLMPPGMREDLKKAVNANVRTVSEVASLVRLPEERVDMWLRYGAMLDDLME